MCAAFLEFASDGHDLSYVKDYAREIAMLQLAKSLRFDGTCCAIRNQDFVDALEQIVAGAGFKLPAGFNPSGAGRREISPSTTSSGP